MSKYFHHGLRNPDGNLRDGNPDFPYIIDHPTSYWWKDRADKLIDETAEAFPYLLWINTYAWHPPAYHQPGDTLPGPTDRISWDMWHNYGRGYHIGHDLGQAARDWVFSYPDPPDIWWQMWNYRMYLRDPDTFKVRIISLAPDALDNEHVTHVHTTIFQDGAQERFRRQLAERQLWVPENFREVEEQVDLEDLKLTRDEVYRFLDQEAGLNEEEDK